MASQFNKTKIRDQLKIAIENAFAPVAIGMKKPIGLPEPVQQKGPSTFSLLTGVASSALGGVQAGYEFNKLLP